MLPYQIISTHVDRHGITKAKLARRIGMDAELLRRSLHGERRFMVEEFLLLCREFNLTLEDFPEN